MNTPIFTLIAVFSLALLPQANYGDEKPAAAQTVSLEKYTNAEKHYSIEYPSTWKKSDVPQLDIVLFAPSDTDESRPRASLNIVSENIGASIPLNTFFDESLNNLKQTLKEVKIENSGTANLNGTESKWVTYTHVMQNVKFKVLQYFVASDKSVYLITFGSVDQDFDNYKKEFEEIISSFKISKS